MEIAKKLVQAYRRKNTLMQKRFPSKSHPGLHYETRIFKDGSGACECPKFHFTHTCSHLETMQQFAQNLTIYQD
jgi:uncharacterized protein YozE (UPF0346 family)